MSARPQPQPTLYEQLEALPEGLTGEILNNQIYTQPQPTGLHVFAASELGYELIGPFERGRGGPGGWWIIDEPELHIIRNTEVLVPDLAGGVPECRRFRRTSVSPWCRIGCARSSRRPPKAKTARSRCQSTRSSALPAPG